MIDFRTSPDRYRHWRLRIDGRVAFLDMDVDPDGGLDRGYELKRNSYDLGVDIELHDAVQRLRFEHPEVGAVVIGSLKPGVFCAGANIGMLAGAAHPLKVNFCKFTNETRNAIEEASAESGQRYLTAIKGTAAGGGYELALATDHIMLVDDRSASVALPEVALLGVLPGTGGLTRLVDKRHVRRDLADVFSTIAEGVKGSRAFDWGLVDELVPAPAFEDDVRTRADEIASQSDRPVRGPGVDLTPLEREVTAEAVRYGQVTVGLDRARGSATIVVHGPTAPPPADADAARIVGSEWWGLAAARQLDDAILHLRTNELELGTFIVKTAGGSDLVAEHDRFIFDNRADWFIREVELLWKRTLKRIDVTSRTVFALIEPGSCFVGILAELAFAADRSYMLDGPWEGETEVATITLSDENLGRLPMANGLSRIATRFWGDAEALEGAEALVGKNLEAGDAAAAGLVTDVMDSLDWDGELRIILEERASFSPDGLTGMEANLRFPGPETLETKIFGRLSAWQNWVFSRPNASGETGALRRYGTGRRPDFDTRRV